MDLFTARRLLGVSANADEMEIKKAYRERVRNVHPDSPTAQQRGTADKEQFIQVQQAYELLTDGPTRSQRSGSWNAADAAAVDDRYQQLLREAEARVAEARRKAAAAHAGMYVPGGGEEFEQTESFADILRDAYGQARQGVKRVLGDLNQPDRSPQMPLTRLERLRGLIDDIAAHAQAGADTSRDVGGFDD